MADEEIITLSSDDEEEKEKEPQIKRRKTIEGIPKSFDGDEMERFSFGVFEEEEEQEKEKEKDNIIFSSTPTRSKPYMHQKTPTPIRRRSISVSCLTSERHKSTEPPKNRVCSTFVVDQIPENSRQDEDSEEEEAEDLNLRALLSPEKKQGVKRKRKDKIEEVQNEFFGVYCLISRSDRPCYKNRCYIGYTVDPNRRIMQHNGGRGKGGAKKTDSRGPWDMVCVVHGFPNHVAALRFEWAWQNPQMSKVIKDRNLKKERKETPFAYQLRIACNLINSQPFCRYALTFRWLITSEQIAFPSSCPLPDHIKIRYGKVKKEMSQVPQRKEDYLRIDECRICGKNIEKIWHLVRCTEKTCNSQFHTNCLAENGLKKVGGANLTDQLFPLKANCPTCSRQYYWGDVIRDQRRMLKISAKLGDRQETEMKDMIVRKDVPHREISP